MDSSKIINLIIIILIVVNLFLAALVGADMIKDNRLQKQAIESMVSILNSRGIAVSDDIGLKGSKLDTYRVSRDLEEEEKRVSSVLGKVIVQDQGGNILFYQGEKGQAVFRGTGGFEMLMNEGTVPAGSDAVEAAIGFLEKLNINVQKDSAESDVSGGAGTVAVNCKIGKTEVINCKVTLSFTNGNLMLVIGTRPLDNILADASVDGLDIATVLMRFMDASSEDGLIFSELKNIELCYIQNASVSGEGTLDPVWKFTTDAGDFFINGLNGKLETIS